MELKVYRGAQRGFPMNPGQLLLPRSMEKLVDQKLSIEYGTFDWTGPDGRKKRVRIYYPNIRVFSYDLPLIKDPMMIQQLLQDLT